MTSADPSTVAPADPVAPAEAREPLLTKQMVIGLLIFAGVLAFFLTQTRLPAVLRKLPTLEHPASGRGLSTFARVVDPEAFPPGWQWVAYGINLWDANAIGMVFAVLLGGAASAALAPEARLTLLLRRRGPVGAGLGGGLGLPLFMCSACSAPVSLGFYRRGVALETTLGMILGSALFNPVGILAIFLLMPASMALARVAFGLAAIFVLVPLVARVRERLTAGVGPHCVTPPPEAVAELANMPAQAQPGWGAAARRALTGWSRQVADTSLLLVPPMLLAGFAVGAVLQLAPPQRLSDVVGSGFVAILATAAVGTLLQLPTLFEIPLVLGVLALGLDAGPATALLVTAPSAGLVTFGLTRGDLGWQAPALLLAGTFAGGVVAGLAVALL